MRLVERANNVGGSPSPSPTRPEQAETETIEMAAISLAVWVRMSRTHFKWRASAFPVIDPQFTCDSRRRRGCVASRVATGGGAARGLGKTSSLQTVGRGA